jgi:hypothetical protein
MGLPAMRLAGLVFCFSLDSEKKLEKWGVLVYN